MDGQPHRQLSGWVQAMGRERRRLVDGGWTSRQCEWVGGCQKHAVEAAPTESRTRISTRASSDSTTGIDGYRPRWLKDKEDF